MISLYVNELLFTGSDIKEIECFKALMVAGFKMSDLGRLTYFLGVEFITISKGIALHKKKYVVGVLKRFNMMDCNPTTTLIEVNFKLDSTSDDDELVDFTLFKKLFGSLR